jgi:hypothetical protein
MWDIKFATILTLSLCFALQLAIPHYSIMAQVDNSAGINGDANTAGVTNDSGIMHNTTGMIDDAFDALKDSFGSFFGK